MFEGYLPRRRGPSRETKERLQIIVTDHAGSITWQGVDVNVVEEWRTGRGDFLIPETWR